jgi:SAM-dependent methyltransferase
VDRQPDAPPSAVARHTSSLREQARRFGLPYAALSAARLATEVLLVRPTENRLLLMEDRLTVLGPAHRAYRDHTVAENREKWSNHPWRDDAEDWTWSPEWKASVIEHLLVPTMPRDGVLLEIGPGGGRWSRSLEELAAQLILVDITEKTLDLCRKHLDGASSVEYIVSPGAELPGVRTASVDGVWSFDVFVHVAPVDIADYLDEIARVLRPGGKAAIHHAGGGVPERRHERGWRSPMSARLFAALAQERGFVVERQVNSWPGGRLHLQDVITVLRRADT